MPLLYHKLYYMVAAPLALLTGSMKASQLLTLLLMLVSGACGMFALVRVLEGSRLAAVAAGISIIAANYTVTNWLVRGAVAEVTAAMLVPWALYHVARARTDGRVRVSAGIVFALLWLAHSVLAYFCGLLLAAAVLLLAIGRAEERRLLWPRAWWRPVLLLVLLLAPWLALIRFFAPAYDFARILTPPFLPYFQFRPLEVYFWDRFWHFGQTVAGYTRQIDVPMLTLLSMAAGAALVQRVWRRQPFARPLSPLALLATIAALVLLLQLSSTNIVYNTIPGALFIQFPWRLLAVLTPCLIASSLLLADIVLPPQVRLVTLGVAASWMLAGSGAFVPIDEPRTGPSQWTSLASLSLSGFREYEPIEAAPIAEAAARLDLQWRASGCEVSRRQASEEMLVVEFDIRCGQPATVPLPLYQSPAHSVTIGDRQMRCVELPEFPALCAVIAPTGASVVAVHMPTVTAVTRRWLGGE